ncbi:hypothetical protein QF035_004246 [Streptomyces umbrinus]|uniref:Secreted protein n=1 Tax=Streptomyces umbrinus TaxID=67370 RepID=A0ABU0SVV5_9ACTN|nr:hypothetical protein [Streptomyces umbrinus]MDQ1026664.1 hypothetical protein [Streptomyces umbrinus]
MRRVRARVTGSRGWAAVSGWAMALGLVVLCAPTATAGGPTSVLVVSPESGQSAALYNSKEDYGELERLLGQPGSGTREEPPGLGVGSGRQINVTWMIHDVSPWRVDRVYLETPRTKDVWIHTAADVPKSMNGYWHKAEQPTAVRALLKKLGVMGESSSGAGAIYPAPWETAEGAAAGSAPEAGSTEQSGTSAAAAAADDDTDWWWAIPGLVTGAVLALGLRPFVGRLPGVRELGRRRVRVREAGPRQELRDV